MSILAVGRRVRRRSSTTDLPLRLRPWSRDKLWMMADYCVPDSSCRASSHDELQLARKAAGAGLVDSRRFKPPNRTGRVACFQERSGIEE